MTCKSKCLQRPDAYLIYVREMGQCARYEGKKEVTMAAATREGSPSKDIQIQILKNLCSPNQI